MATNPQGLPLLYNGLEALSSLNHKDWKGRHQGFGFLKNVHAVPLTVEEFPLAQRHYPIVFASGPDPVPLALMGLNEGVNVFVNDDGTLVSNDIYLPAYVRRYPWLLAKLNPDAEELSLCFDPTAGLVGPFEDGEPVFDGDQPSVATKGLLEYCEQFEMAGQRTNNFVKELVASKLLIEGELTIQHDSASQPYIYRGFQMVSEEAVTALRGDQARKMIQNGMLGVIFAHLFSLSLSREIFQKQFDQGKVPQQQPQG